MNEQTWWTVIVCGVQDEEREVNSNLITVKLGLGSLTQASTLIQISIQLVSLWRPITHTQPDGPIAICPELWSHTPFSRSNNKSRLLLNAQHGMWHTPPYLYDGHYWGVVFWLRMKGELRIKGRNQTLLASFASLLSLSRWSSKPHEKALEVGTRNKLRFWGLPRISGRLFI